MRKKVISCILIISLLILLISGCANEYAKEGTDVSLSNEEGLVAEVSESENTDNNEIIDLSNNSDLSTAQVGEVVKFGRYEQDNNLENGKEPIEWIVLDEQDGKLLLVSQYALESLPFYITENGELPDNVTWENSYLRLWLNDSFYSSAFVSEEQEKICICEITNTVFYSEFDEGGYVSLVNNNFRDLTNYSVDYYDEPEIKQCELLGNTQDNVFILDYTELEKYMNTKIIEEEMSWEYEGSTLYATYYYLGMEECNIIPTIFAEKWQLANGSRMHITTFDNMPKNFVWYRTSVYVNKSEADSETGYFTGALIQQTETGMLYGYAKLDMTGYVFPAIWVEK